MHLIHQKTNAKKLALAKTNPDLVAFYDIWLLANLSRS